MGAGGRGRRWGLFIETNQSRKKRGKWVRADVVFPPQACSDPKHGFYAGEEMLVIVRTASALVLWGLQLHLTLSSNMYAVHCIPGLGRGLCTS